MEGLIIERGEDGKRARESSASSRENGSGDIIHAAGGQIASPTMVLAAVPVADPPVCLKMNQALFVVIRLGLYRKVLLSLRRRADVFLDQNFLLKASRQPNSQRKALGRRFGDVLTSTASLTAVDSQAVV